MKIALQISAIACALSISGCSTIQSWFPDKEKDYQFTTELPPLVIPNFLVQKSSVPTHTAPIGLPVAKEIEPVKPKKLTVKTVVPAADTTPESKQVSHPPTLANVETELSRDEIQISLTHENQPTLNLNVQSARAWRIVGKALSRSNIEVTNRHQDSGQIHIQVADSKLKPQPEKSLWDNTVSVFNPFAENEQSYILKFNEMNSKTAVTVLNSELHPIIDGMDNKLLVLLFDSIKADLGK